MKQQLLRAAEAELWFQKRHLMRSKEDDAAERRKLESKIDSKLADMETERQLQQQEHLVRKSQLENDLASKERECEERAQKAEALERAQRTANLALMRATQLPTGTGGF